MGLSTDELQEIEGMLACPDGDPVPALRRRFPRLSLTRCDASDLDAEEPYARAGGFALYFVDAADHCVRITSDASRASGLVLARLARRP